MRHMKRLWYSDDVFAVVKVLSYTYMHSKHVHMCGTAAIAAAAAPTTIPTDTICFFYAPALFPSRIQSPLFSHSNIHKTHLCIKAHIKEIYVENGIEKRQEKMEKAPHTHTNHFFFPFQKKCMCACFSCIFFFYLCFAGRSIVGVGGSQKKKKNERDVNMDIYI